MDGIIKLQFGKSLLDRLGIRGKGNGFSKSSGAILIPNPSAMLLASRANLSGPQLCQKPPDVRPRWPASRRALAAWSRPWRRKPGCAMCFNKLALLRPGSSLSSPRSLSLARHLSARKQPSTQPPRFFLLNLRILLLQFNLNRFHPSFPPAPRHRHESHVSARPAVHMFESPCHFRRILTRIGVVAVLATHFSALIQVRLRALITWTV